ncbi:CAAX protease [Burkholderia sp. TSV86]|nr:CAAX protease [Burkholderia sp. TSV86]
MDQSVNESRQSVPPPCAMRRMLRRIVFGPHGIRAGWGVLLFVAIFALCIGAMAFVARRLMPMPHDDGSLSVAAGFGMECMQLAAVAIATAVLAKCERRSPFSFGLRGSACGRRLLFGVGWGFVAISCLVLALSYAGYLRLDAPSLHGGRAWIYAVVWGASFMMTGLFEETLLRGYLQYTLTRWIGFWWGAVLLSALFGAMHALSSAETAVGLVSAALFGVVFCLSLWYTGSLWWAIGFHAAWDWGESYFYGAADSGRLVEGVLFAAHPLGNAWLSGGAAGPEGSMFVFVVLAVMVVAMRAWWGRRDVRSPFADRRGLAPDRR